MTKEITLQKQLHPIAKEAEVMEILDEKDMSHAVEVLSKLNKFNDSITEEKEKVTKPLNEALKAERSRWKPLEAMYEDAIALLRKKMSSYQTEQVRKRKEEEAKIASRIKEGKGNLSLDKAVEKIEKLKTPEKEVATEEGLVQFREVQKFEVTDIRLLPIEFHLPNEAMIKKAMATGQQLEGVRYYTEQIPINYR